MNSLKIPQSLLLRERQCGSSRNKNIKELTDMPINKIKDYLNSLKLSKTEKLISEQILKETNKRLQFLVDVGLEYLTLSRGARNIVRW